MKDLEERVSKLERRLRDGVIVLVALGLALLIFTGYTWQSIPKRAADALEDAAIKELEAKAMDSAKAAEEAQHRAKTAASSAKNELNRARAAANKVELVEIARITALEERLSKKVLWGVNASDYIFYSKDEGKTWHQVGGRLKQISVGEGVLWGVNASDYIYYSKDEGKTWHHVGGRLKHISVWP